jgi:hypothetical protein
MVNNRVWPRVVFLVLLIIVLFLIMAQTHRAGGQDESGSAIFIPVAMSGGKCYSDGLHVLCVDYGKMKDEVVCGKSVITVLNSTTSGYITKAATLTEVGGTQVLTKVSVIEISPANVCEIIDGDYQYFIYRLSTKTRITRYQ